jgi:addiction module RelE/StbE family toxin
LELALDDLDAAVEYIARENPQAAQRVAQRFWQSGQSLGDNPKIGRLGRIENTREWVVNKTSHILAYRIRNNQIEIMRVLHERRSWPDTLT